MNHIDELLKMLRQCQIQQKNLAKIRGKLCGRDEKNRAKILKMEHSLKKHRKLLSSYIANNAQMLLNFEEQPLPKIGKKFSK